MRVTDSLMSQSFLRNLSTNTKKMLKYQEQLSTQKEVNKPSDDPLRISKILDLNNTIIQNDQYKTTISDAVQWTNVQDSALSSTTKSLQRIKTLIQSSANGTMTHSDRQANKAEIESEIHGVVDALNTNFGGRYVFAGMNTTEVPFEVKSVDGEITEIIYSGTKETDGNTNLSREIAPGVSIELNTDGNALMNEKGTKEKPNNLGSFFNDVLKALDSDDTEELSGLLDRADQQLENVVSNRSKTGAIFNRLEATSERNNSEKLNLKTMLSENQDIDLAEKYMEFTMEQTAYQASLSMGTKILQTNILNYL
ncbi:flagellar hook-associated protein 3 FlgL [Carnobacterium iners]|uniref:Flagellar hook-associated protein 3 FlgL n=1 Tax=Carnobacterium iners TaxID=1073423 RepID=A0A1X7N016_9LACT|nr:flagellar hook-associated protein FlgL [Carnobacterium iners]SEK21477.1 flagellar hook-associated protein 3 FlgL [Carnobacterium iners]SMH30561.1 flagellar hook-associated protein 3 FlgL [Carnobacterium iners]